LVGRFFFFGFIVRSAGSVGWGFPPSIDGWSAHSVGSIIRCPRWSTPISGLDEGSMGSQPSWSSQEDISFASASSAPPSYRLWKPWSVGRSVGHLVSQQAKSLIGLKQKPNRLVGFCSRTTQSGGLSPPQNSDQSLQPTDAAYFDARERACVRHHRWKGTGSWRG